MNFPPKRMIVGAALVLAVLALFFIVRPGDDSNDDETTQPSNPALVTGDTGASRSKPEKPAKPVPPPVAQVVVKNGEPRDGVVDLNFDQGETIRFTVKSDVEDEVHVHGYDVSKEVLAGGTAKFSFPAEITGVFEVELEHSAVPIANLQVNP
ncbi:MAG TPA: hypothetical protein PKD76_01005 [Solirubrobacterales bacterium]|nr:hypothetical protein [Solirubrobacterales bacterium]